ncbi:coronin-7-like [Mya arenaria]|uniref:coronin-7-like n=1 Tax=Mya arenaria TaxID=6604 RepID=UPI0022E30C44|nr:coronin-7-like [Mya arenaria]XP_052795521.1 coronin-7-like [Mya arenaria]XP_052795522.1 coronin-7-like [Mya arenaria]
MAWRFKVSKYKNAAPKFPKREELIQDLPHATLMQTCGNHIAASCLYIAFDTGGGGSVGILPLDTAGRVGHDLPLLKAHADYITDLQFSPFHDDVLSTCSADSTVKVWRLPEKERLSEELPLLTSSCSFVAGDRRAETLAWHPTADDTLAVATGQSVRVVDVSNPDGNKLDFSGHDDQVLSLSWRSGGTTLVTSCKDRKLRVIDPRAGTSVQECVGHEGVKDCQAVWVGNTDFIFTTGFEKQRSREVKLWDTRNMQHAVKTVAVDSNTGTLMPLLDEDTHMMLVVGKADTSWSYYEISTAEPFVTKNTVEHTEKGEQIRGACLVPKRAMEVMQGEVDRLLLLFPRSIAPLPYIVPRRQYRDYHGDLFPDTKSDEPALSAGQWFAGENGQVSLISLDPSKRSAKKVVKDKELTSSKPKADKPTPSQQSSNTSTHAPVQPSKPAVTKATKPAVSKVPQPEPKPEPPVPTEPSKASKTFAAMHQSKCKYLKGITEHPSKHIVNVRKLCRNLPIQSNLFAANTKRCAVPIEGAGGLVCILELDKPGRLPDTGVPMLQNGSKVNDFMFDPFDDRRLLIGCDNAKVYVWEIPEGGLTETLDDYESYLMGHSEKIYFVRFHPLAKDIVMTAAYDMTLKIWDLADSSEVINISCHGDEIFSGEWSQDGRYIATVCKDGLIRIFDPRNSTEAIKVGKAPDGNRAARVVWACDMKYLVVSGFDKSSFRQLSVYSVANLGDPLHVVALDVSPSLLVPHYDLGTSTVFLTGRGDSYIQAFEVSEEFPHLFPLTPMKPEGQHQGMALMPVTTCDVRAVEMARIWRLTQTSVEPMSITVPRVKTEYFQDDLFPDTPQTGSPTMTSQEWLNGGNKQPVKISLRPKDMKPLSEAPVEAPKARKYDSYSADTYKTDEQKKEELISAMTDKLGQNDEPLPQDKSEGVDSDEWEDY